MATNVNKSYYVYNNGAYELQHATTIPENSKIAKSETFLRRITGPIPREDVCRLVEHINLDSSNWEEQMKKVLSEHGFIVTGINSELPIQGNSNPELGMTVSSYVKSYFNGWTLLGIAASASLFLAPGLTAKYFQPIAVQLKLPDYDEAAENIASYSAKAWIGGGTALIDKAKTVTDKIPTVITGPALSYIGYKGLEALVTKAIEYPATDYKTWTALNLQKFLKEVYPQMIPVQYANDPVLNEVKSPDGTPVRSPFIIENDVEFGRVYEEHVLKNILSNQERTCKKLFCPKNGTTEIRPTDFKRDEKLSDKIELRLLLLDAHQNKNARVENT